MLDTVQSVMQKVLQRGIAHSTVQQDGGIAIIIHASHHHTLAMDQHHHTCILHNPDPWY